MSSDSEEKSFDHQIAMAVTALASALVRQPGIDSKRLRLDFMDILEGLEGGPENVGRVGRRTASLMESFEGYDPDKPAPV